MNLDKFTDDALEGEIVNIVIPSMFPNLNRQEREALANYIIKLLNIISICFKFDLKLYDDYIYQIRQNNYQDIKWLISHMLPYINTDSDRSKIYSFNDIYINKKKDVNINE